MYENSANQVENPQKFDHKNFYLVLPARLCVRRLGGGIRGRVRGLPQQPGLSGRRQHFWANM